MSALERKLATFNLNGVIEVKDFIKVIEESSILLGRKDTSPQTTDGTEVKNPYTSTPQSTITPTVKKDDTLDAKELKLIEQAGFTKEKYLELKEKMPGYINGLLSNV